MVYMGVFLSITLFSWLNFAMHRQGPHYFPLGDPVERFGDLIRFTAKFQYGVDPRIKDGDHLLGTLYPRNYAPLGVDIYLFLLQVCAPYAVAVFLSVFYAAMFTACILFWRRVRGLAAYTPALGAAIFLTGLLGWGCLQVAMRGNIEGWLFIPTMLGAWFLVRKDYISAGVSFGIAMCIKPYPFLWLLLLARHRQWKASAAGLAAFMASTVASLLVLNPNPFVAYHQLAGEKTFFPKYIAAFRPMDEMMLEHSVLQTLKTLVRTLRNRGLHFSHAEYQLHSSHPVALEIYHFYLLLGAAIGILVLWRMWNKPMLNQIFAIATVTTTLPLVAGDYTLVVLLIPMALFAIMLLQDVSSGRVPLSLPRMLRILVPCACVMATVPLGVLHAVFETAALLVLLVSVCVIDLPTSMFGEQALAETKSVENGPASERHARLANLQTGS